MSDKPELSHSEQQAVAQLESIKEMVAALDCDYDRLEELRELIQGEGCEETCEEYKEELAELEAEAGECKDRDDAQRRIDEDPLSIEVRSDWHTPGDKEGIEPAEYCILLCTGGPACRIIGDLASNEPTSARLEHQDWGTPWTEWITTGEDHEALLTYASCFCYGE